MFEQKAQRVLYNPPYLHDLPRIPRKCQEQACRTTLRIFLRRHMAALGSSCIALHGRCSFSLVLLVVACRILSQCLWDLWASWDLFLRCNDLFDLCALSGVGSAGCREKLATCRVQKSMRKPMTYNHHLCNEKGTATPVGGSGTLRVTLISPRKQIIQIDFRALSQYDEKGTKKAATKLPRICEFCPTVVLDSARLLDVLLEWRAGVFQWSSLNPKINSDTVRLSWLSCSKYLNRIQHIFNTHWVFSVGSFCSGGLESHSRGLFQLRSLGLVRPEADNFQI